MTERKPHYVIKKKCDTWTRKNKVYETCQVSVSVNLNKQVIIEGTVREPLRSRLLSLGSPVYVQYWASAPSDDRNSWVGSDLPFANEEIAYHKSPNIGRTVLNPNGSFVIKIVYPNSYYTNMGSNLTKPNIKLLFNDEHKNMFGKIVQVTL